MNRRRALLAVLLAGAVLRLAHWATILPTTYPRLPETYEASDMAAYVEWAGRIQAGDLLGRDTYHPSFAWSDALGDRADWTRWWGSWEVFHQAPLYPYLLALLLLGGVPFTLLVQLALGALQPLIVYRLGLRLAGPRAGLIGAALTALYVPFVLYQGVLLRDWIPALLEPLAVLLLLEGRAQRRPALEAAAGVTLGLAFLVKPTVVLLAPAVGLWVWLSDRGDRRRVARRLSWVALGTTLALQPLVIRNLAVGAPPLAASNRFAEGFLHANARGGGAYGFTLPPTYATILEQAQGDKLEVVHATLATWEGDWGGFLRHQVLKLRAALGPDEIPSNVDLGFARERSPALWWGLGFAGVLAPAALGVLVALRDPRRHALGLLWLGLGFVSLLPPAAVGRYRLAFAQAVIVYAAVGLAWLTRALRAGRGRSALGALGLGYALHLLVLPSPVLREDPWVVAYPGEYVAAIKLHLREGEHAEALDELARYRARVAGLEHVPPQLTDMDRRLEGVIRLAWGRELLAAGEPQAAHAQWTRVVRDGEPELAQEAFDLLAGIDLRR